MCATTRAKGKNASLSLAFHEEDVLVRMAISYVSKHKPGKIYPLRPG